MNQSNQYNIYEVKNYEYGEYSPQEDQEDTNQQNSQQSYQYKKSNKSNKDYIQENKNVRSSDQYSEKYLDYPQNNYLKQKQSNKIQTHNMKGSPQKDLGSSGRQQLSKVDNYGYQGTKFGENHLGKQLFYEQMSNPTKVNNFHKENVHQHSNKKLRTIESTQDQQNVSGLYEKYYQNNQNQFEVSPYSQKYHPNLNLSGGNRGSYHNRSQDSYKKYDNSECELSYEDILYQGNDSYNEGKQSQNNSSQKYDYNNSQRSTKEFWNMRKNKHSNSNSMISQNKYNQDDRNVSNSFNNTRGRGALSKSNYIEDQNNSQEQYQGRSRSQSQNNYQHSQTHRSPYQYQQQDSYLQERSSSFDRSSQYNYQDKSSKQRLQLEGTDKSFQHQAKTNNYFQENPSHSRGNSQINTYQQKRKQSQAHNQSYSYENNQMSLNQSGYSNQLQFEQNHKRQPTPKLSNTQDHPQNNVQQQYQQQNQQQLFINQLIQNAHSAHQSLELDLQKISDTKQQQRQQQQLVQNQKNQHNAQAQQIQQNIQNFGNQQNQIDTSQIISQQNLLIQNLIQQLLQVQAQQMTNTLNSSAYGLNNLGQNDIKNQSSIPAVSNNMQQINYLLQQQIQQQQQKQQELQKPQNQIGLNNIIQQLNPSNQELLLNLLQQQQNLNNSYQNLQQKSFQNTINPMEAQQNTLQRASSNPQILNLQEPPYNDQVQSPVKIVEYKLKDISEKQDDMSRRLDQILDYSKKKLNQSLSSKHIQDPSSTQNVGYGSKNQSLKQEFLQQQEEKNTKNQQTKNLLRSKSQLTVHDKDKQGQKANLQDPSNQQNFQDFSKIMDDIIKKQELTIKNLQKERKLSKIAKEQHETSQNSFHQASTDDLVSKELSEIQHYIKNFQNSYSQIDSSRVQSKSTKDLLKNIKSNNDSFERTNKELKQFVNTPSTLNNQTQIQSVANSKPNTQRKKWGEESTYISNKQPLNLHEAETPSQTPAIGNQDSLEIDDIKQRFKSDFKKYLEKSNSKKQTNSNQVYSPSNQIYSQNEDYDEQNRLSSKQNMNTQGSQQLRSPKRWDIPQSKQGVQTTNQNEQIPKQQNNQQIQQQIDKKTPQQWSINWEEDNQGEKQNKQKSIPKRLMSNNSRGDLQSSSPFNNNIQKKQAFNNIFEQNESNQNQKGRSISSHHQENKQNGQISKQQQYQQFKPPTFSYQESFQPLNYDENNNINYQEREDAYPPQNQFDIVFDDDTSGAVSKSKQSLADMFKSKKGDLACKLEENKKRKTRDRTVDAPQPSKTKEELAQIRKELQQQSRRRDLSANNLGKNQASLSRGRQDPQNMEISFDMNQKNKNLKDPPPELLNRLIYGLKAKVDKKDYKKLTMKNYEQLPEIKKKKEEEKKKQEMADRIKHKKEYEQKLRQRMKNVNFNKSQMQQSQVYQNNYQQSQQHNQQQYNQQQYQYYDYD